MSISIIDRFGFNNTLIGDLSSSTKLVPNVFNIIGPYQNGFDEKCLKVDSSAVSVYLNEGFNVINPPVDISNLGFTMRISNLNTINWNNSGVLWWQLSSYNPFPSSELEIAKGTGPPSSIYIRIRSNSVAPTEYYQATVDASMATDTYYYVACFINSSLGSQSIRVYAHNHRTGLSQNVEHAYFANPLNLVNYASCNRYDRGAIYDLGIDEIQLFTFSTYQDTQDIIDNAYLKIDQVDWSTISYDENLSNQFTVSGNGSVATWSLISGTLPDGITLSSSGLLACTGVLSDTRTVHIIVIQALIKTGIYRRKTFVLYPRWFTGINIDSSTGIISGESSEVGIRDLLVSATDTDGRKVLKTS